MAETVTNKAINTGTITNVEYGATDLTWDEADFTWDEGSGTWDNPYALANRPINTASITNKALT